MINLRDLHIAYQSQTLAFNDVVLGTLALEYEVRAYRDLRNLEETEAYIVTCRQQLVFPGPGATSLGPQNISGYHDYPALIVSSLTPAAPTGSPAVTLELQDCYPKTLNTAVAVNQNASTDANSSYSSQYSSGSTFAQANSYDTSVSVSASAGFFGDSPTGSMSVGASVGTSTSETQAWQRSMSQGRSAGLNLHSGISSSMSMKDWGAYVSIANDKTSLTWVWGQEYPWNVMEYCNLKADRRDINLPEFVLKRLRDTAETQVYPPSQLSLFGVNFVGSSRWVVKTGPAPQASSGQLQFTHGLQYFTASHGYDADSNFTAHMNDTGALSITGPQLDLPVLGLDPIRLEGPDNGAVVGFAPHRFLEPPGQAAASGDTPPLFRIKSGANNLYVTGSGFSVPANADAPLTATLVAGSPAKLTIRFKIADATNDYSLFLKHWKTSAQGCVMNLTVNGLSIVKHVDAQESGGGADNVTTIILRNKGYSSDEYYDYLSLGLNTIEISIAPSADGSAAGTCGYALRALAIG